MHAILSLEQQRFSISTERLLVTLSAHLLLGSWSLSSVQHLDDDASPLIVTFCVSEAEYSQGHEQDD